jgi:hypothetical protein
MSWFRSIIRQSPAIVISLTALTLSLGGGVGYAASVAAGSAQITKITWHALPLRNQWRDAAKAGFAGEGNAAYTVSNAVVYLTGVVDRADQSLPIPSVIGVLPKGARPAHRLWFAAFNEAAAGQSQIAIFPNGDVEVLGNGGDENFFTSLAGIEFPLGS